MSIAVGSLPSCSFCKKPYKGTKRFFLGYSGQMCGECLDKLIPTLGAADPEWRERTIAILIETRSAPRPTPPAEPIHFAVTGDHETIAAP